MFNHISIGVRDIARTKKFYDAALKPLGFKCLSDGADSLGYVSLEGLIAATDAGKDRLCRACFDGVYPVEIPLRERLGGQLADLETERTDVDGLPVSAPGLGAVDALTRP